MEDTVFSMEGLKCEETPMLTDCRSYEDTVLKDSRVLSNLLTRQDFQKQTQPDCFETIQTELKPHMRKIVADWMIEVTEEQQCQPDVFHLAINYLDRILSKVRIEKSQFQLVACVCMFLASKFKETCPLAAEHLVIYTDYSTTTSEITRFEMLILDVLQWDLSAVTPYSILDQILRTIQFDPIFDPAKVRLHAESYLALAATDYAFSLKSPALVAVSSLGAALRGLNPSGLESMLSSIQITTGHELVVIKECMDEIEASVILRKNGGNFTTTTSTDQNQNKQVQTCPAASSAKVIPQSNSFNTGTSASTTPTDVMDVNVF